MSSKETILQAISKNRQALIPLEPVDSVIADNADSLLDKFTLLLTSIGGQVEVMESIDPVNDYLLKIAGKNNRIVNVFSGDYVGNTTEAGDLENVFVACIAGGIAVAENGAVWVDESMMGNRMLPFICQHLVLVLKATNLVANMHEAYRNIETTKTGYGVFIAGPSKTADIEQSLVIGAHGPRSLRVIFVKE